jgi:hypothetical protein
MNTAELYAKNIIIEHKGIYLLEWSEKPDLVRALIVLIPIIGEEIINPTLLDSGIAAKKYLKDLFQIKQGSDNILDDDALGPDRKEMLFLFLQQAASSTVGPILNGWRSALAGAPGTILFVRSPDVSALQRSAPDLSSFIGPKMADTSNFLSIWSHETQIKLSDKLPKSIWQILEKLPGSMPQNQELATWIAENKLES